jgi:hypothetical protein
MQPGCSTATTRPGKGPGMPGLVVAALLWDWATAAAAATIECRNRSLRRRVTKSSLALIEKLQPTDADKRPEYGEMPALAAKAVSDQLG